MKAEFIREVYRDKCGHRKLWKVGDDFIMTSAFYTTDHGLETFVFRAKPDGEIVDFEDLEGSFIGDLDHQRAIDGYVESLKGELK